ncbi:MAG: D-alanyl-D-alanine carboxypeptidase [Sphingobacterium sp.]|nr:D-alanyl-D-alanine carboxypeptidase [Sphingobacterium sp.]
MKHPLIAALVVAALTAGCAQKPTPTVAPRPLPQPKSGVKALKADLASYYQAQAFENAVWGVLVKSLTTGETLYSLNPGTFLMPASNMKVVTMAAAAERLGWDFTFTTKVVATGPVEGGVLKGDLVVRRQRRSVAGRPADRGPTVVERWADQIRARGITRVDGRVVGHDNVFDDEGLGQGWAWDYLAYGYADTRQRPRLQRERRAAELRARIGGGRPGGGGGPARRQRIVHRGGSQDGGPGRRGRCQCREAAGQPEAGRERFRAGRQDRRHPDGFGGEPHGVHGGRVPRGAPRAAASTWRAAPFDADELPAPPDVTGAETLVSYTSPPLSEIGKVLLKVSQNLYADTLLKAIGRPADGGPATTREGRRVLREVLQGWGIAPERYLQADGSGLSRYNYLTADVLVTVLTRMYADDRHYVAVHHRASRRRRGWHDRGPDEGHEGPGQRAREDRVDRQCPRAVGLRDVGRRRTAGLLDDRQQLQRAAIRGRRDHRPRGRPPGRIPPLALPSHGVVIRVLRVRDDRRRGAGVGPAPCQAAADPVPEGRGDRVSRPAQSWRGARCTRPCWPVTSRRPRRSSTSSRRSTSSRETVVDPGARHRGPRLRRPLPASPPPRCRSIAPSCGFAGAGSRGRKAC